VDVIIEVVDGKATGNERFGIWGVTFSEFNNFNRVKYSRDCKDLI